MSQNQSSESAAENYSAKCFVDHDYDDTLRTESELTSAFCKERINFFYEINTSTNFDQQSFSEMEKLKECDLKKFVLYRNAISCFANGLDPAHFVDLFHRDEPLLFVMEEKRKNLLTFTKNSAFSKTKNFTMAVNKNNSLTYKFSLELNEEFFLKIIKNLDGSVAMIKSRDCSNFQPSSVINFERGMAINWQNCDVKLIAGRKAVEPPLTPKHLKIKKSFQLNASLHEANISDNINRPTMFPSAQVAIHAQETTIKRLKIKEPKTIECPVCHEVIDRQDWSRHLRKCHQMMLCRLCKPPLEFSTGNISEDYRKHLEEKHSRKVSSIEQSKAMLFGWLFKKTAQNNVKSHQD